jgi:ubiquitin-like protein ATG12
MDDKVCVEFRNAGDAPRLKTSTFRVSRSTLVLELHHRLSSLLKLPSDESLFLFVGTAFKPSLDESIGQLYDCFAVHDMLTLYYCYKEAWG